MKTLGGLAHAGGAQNSWGGTGTPFQLWHMGVLKWAQPPPKSKRLIFYRPSKLGRSGQKWAKWPFRHCPARFGNLELIMGLWVCCIMLFMCKDIHNIGTTFCTIKLPNFGILRQFSQPKCTLKSTNLDENAKKRQKLNLLNATPPPQMIQ